jgi:hypothetical protein
MRKPYVEFRKLHSGESRWHIGGNLFDAIDRKMVGPYMSVHGFGYYFFITR